MKMILKIAAGVCAGILAALALINAPAWFEKARQQSLEDDARSVIWNTTPNVAITKCGKPFYDGPSTLMTGEEYADIYRDLRFDAVPSYYGGHTVDVNLNVYTSTSVARRIEAVESLESRFVN